MNVNRYRIVFNRARGLLMAVAEIACARGKSPANSNGPAAVAPPGFSLARLRPAAFAALLACGAQLALMHTASAQVVAYKAAPASQRPTILQAGNGVPLVNIQTPSAAGVSRNTYSQFDVDANGVILNNARNNALTQLGGWVQGNPWLARGSARVILNEVVSANPSQLLGYIEVAGSAAQVVIANPAGITCNGCGFINASRATLTTGTPIVNGGNLDGYRVEGGTIRIDGAGLDASRSAYTDLIARAVKVNAALWAQTLKVTAGANVVSADNSSATPIAGSGPAPAFAIDVASLGGMYAGKITLVGTEAGVGVRNAGWIGASAGEVIVTADGRLTNSGSLVAAGYLGIDTRAGIGNTGTLYAQDDLTLATRGNLDNIGGLIAAGNNTTLTASGAGSQITGDATSVFAAGLNADGNLASTGKLTLSASEQVAAHGQQVAGGDLAISARSLDLSDSSNSAQNIALTASAGDLDLTRASNVASGTFSAHATQALRHDDARSNAGQLDLVAASLANARGELVQTGSGSTAITLAGDLDNTAGRIATNSLHLSLSAQTLTNTDGSIEHAGSGNLAIRATTLTGTRGSIVSNGALALSVGTATLDAATTVADALNIVAGSLDNQGGLLSQSGSGASTITVAGHFDNRGGTFSSKGRATLTANDLDNRSSGQIVVSSDLDLTTGDLANDSGRISAGGNLIAVAQAVGNAAGLIVAGNDLSLTASRLDNSDGTLGAVAGSLNVNVSGALDNTRGRIEAAQNLTLASNGLSNTDGTVVGNALAIDTRSQLLDNRRGILVATASLDLQTGQLTNHGGLIEAADVLTLDTHGQTLDNSGAGNIIGQRSVNIASGALDNAGGLIGAKGNLDITGTTLANTAGGLISSEADIALIASSLDNRGGQIQALGAIDVRASGQVNNDASLLRAGLALNIAAGSLSNADTLGTDQGLEGQSLTIAASSIDNRSGTMRADTALAIESSGTLDNSAGLISSAQTVALRDTAATKTLAITNTAGTVIAGTRLDIDSARLSGDGKLLSLGDLAVKLVADFTHSGAFAEITADGRASVETAGTLTNAAKLQAGTALALTAASIDNQSAGQILAPQLKLTATAAHTLTNRGLIDGDDTHLDAVTLNNLGTGRIYGDHLSIAATTLNNEAEGVDAPVIAARSRLDLAVGTLNNREGALLFSVGDLAIGGSLDADNHATGTAGTINNASATIEALGSLNLNATLINNTNEHFSTQLVTTGSEGIDQWLRTGSGTRYRPEEVSLSWTSAPGVVYHPPASDGMSYMGGQGFFSNNKNNYVYLNTPSGTASNFWLYSFTRTTQETQMLTSDPGKITAGGDLLLTAATLKNDNSNILAGGNLLASLGTLDNTATAGQRTVSDSGTAWNVYPDKKHKDSDRNAYAYNPAPTVTGFTLSAGRLEGNTAPGGSGTLLAALSVGGVGGSVDGATGASTAIGSGSAVPRITRITLPGATGGMGTVVATVRPTGTLPTSSLYRINPAAGQPLVETDPRFASYRNWLSSSYMLTQLKLNPATTQKRLGDGFYEQRLINEQVAQLTGRRFLVGFANEEEQYRALMNAGITYANAWQLIPGVALTADQMAQLTSDMVWLVEQDVTLADGSTQKVLAPQLYARTREGDLAPSGALLADKTLALNVAGNLNNLGTLAGRQLVSLSAENVRNLGGRVTGDEVWLTARRDIDNLGGTLEADQRLDLFAERNINIESTTRSAGGRTNIDRIAALYVNNPGGTLQLEANGDIGLLAAYLINNAPTAAGVPGGATRIDAGNNLTLGTVTTTYAESVGDGKHARQESGSNEVGTTVQSAGDLTLIAGRDLTARAANVTSEQGRLLASAGQDLRIEAGESTLNVAEQHKTKSKGFLSSSKTTTRDTLNEMTAIASTFSGDSTTLIADRDIAIKGSNVVATNDTTLIATRNLNIEAASQTHAETHFTKTKESGVFSSGGVGFTIGKKQQSTDQKTDATLAAKSTVGSTYGNVLLLAGENYRQVGSDVIAVQGDIDIAAKTVDIVEARQTSRTVTETKSKQSGFTLAFTSPVISAIQTAQQMSEAAKDTKDGRMKLLAAANVGLAANNAADAVIAGQGKTVEIKNPDGSSTLKDNQLPVLNDKGEVAGTRDANAADKMGGVGINLSLGGSKSSSKTTQTSDTAAASNLTAGRDINITASGANEQSDLTIQGAKVTAARNLSLTAEDEIRLLAAKNTADQKSTNQNSSASVGIGFMVGGTQNGFTIQAGVSGGKGKADGNDLNWTNTQVEAGQTLTLESGGNTTMKGAVAKAEKVVADIGKNLIIESLQDTSTYDSKQKSLGVSVSLCIPPFCYGAASTGSVSASGSKVKSDFASVTEQSGIRAGDGGFQVAVKGDTDLKGGAITSTQAAIDDNKNRFLTDGELTISDIQNKAEYSAKSVSVNVGTGFSAAGALTPGGTSAGFGKDGDKASSTTLAAISGVAGNTAARTGDKETGIAKTFDADKVQKEIDAQTKITQMFGQLAPKAAADFAKTRYDDLLAQAKQENDPAKKTELLHEAKQWDEGGAFRIALHTAIGGLAGGASGALGAGATAAAAPLLNELQDNIAKGLKEAGASDGIAMIAGQLIAGTTAAGIGAAVGGNAGAATGFNVDANNRQLHETEKQRIRQLANGDKQKEQRLSTAACALVKCYAEFAKDSPEYAVFKAISDEGEKPEYATERSLLSQQTDVTAGRSGVTYKLFQYGLGEQALDGLKQADNTYQITTRVLGGVQAVGAAATAVAGTTITATGAASCAPSAGAGCLVAAGGAALTLYSIDQTKAGVTTLMDGTPSSTIGGAFVSQWLGISPEAAELVYGIAGLSPAVAEAYAINKAVNQTAKLNTATRETNLPATNPFTTKGVDFTPDMLNNNPAVKAMYNDYLVAFGGDATRAEMLTKQAVQSGESLPVIRQLGRNDELVRLVPVGNDAGLSSFYMTRTQYDMLIGTGKNAQQVADALGLPASSYAGGGFRGFQAVSIQAQPGKLATAYETTIAPAQQGAYTASGQLKQLVVPNLKDFTAPTPIPGGVIPATGGR